ncbi:MAG TPA: hypothetical protein VE631_11040, partial [Alphaproteobacteria bacterium]|nr:hypothetical protein [Alphaproteobacteria bacterium]
STSPRGAAAERLAEGVRLSAITRHMVGLFAGQPGARAWRRSLSENACRPGAGLGVVRAALAQVPRAEEPREDLRASA